jgi:ADP-ribosylglycohydrolase
MTKLQDKIKGGLFGLLIGDALGVPYEFHGPEDIPGYDEIEMTPPEGFWAAHTGTPAGTWSDDGAQALCLLASLLDKGKFEPNDFGRRLVQWRRVGYMAVDDRVFDIGNQTNSAIEAMQHGGVTPLEAGMTGGEKAQGNGSLMRALPLALWHQGTDSELVRDAHLQSQITHGSLVCQVACALYCLWARRILRGAAHPWHEAFNTLSQIYGVFWSDPDCLVALRQMDWHEDAGAGDGSGWVLSSMQASKHLIGASDLYEDVVKGAIALGNDTDTTACIAGGLAGLRGGIESIPGRWIEQLRGKELVQPLLDLLLERWENAE